MFWLPTYHDMGLIGGVITNVFGGTTNVLISPVDFLQKPITWLAAISKYRLTISGGPNFAYDLCVRKITDEQRATLDLSSWSLAFVGAEPVCPATLERFAAAFAPCGFKPSAFYPCYGLAEATLMVSGPRRGSGATVRAFHDTALTENRVEPVPDDGDGQARRLVACGSPVDTIRVVIVNPKTHTEAAPGCVGEIWVAGAVSRPGILASTRSYPAVFQRPPERHGRRPVLAHGRFGVHVRWPALHHRPAGRPDYRARSQSLSAGYRGHGPHESPVAGSRLRSRFCRGRPRQPAPRSGAGGRAQRAEGFDAGAGCSSHWRYSMSMTWHWTHWCWYEAAQFPKPPAARFSVTPVARRF